MQTYRNQTTIDTKDCNGNLFQNGDSMHLVKDLKVKGSSTVLKRGAKIRNIKLTNDPAESNCKIEGTAMVFKTEFVKGPSIIYTFL